MVVGDLQLGDPPLGSTVFFSKMEESASAAKARTTKVEGNLDLVIQTNPRFSACPYIEK